jgi:uncharacterized protein
MTSLTALLIGAVSGFISGILGIGGAVIMIPAMTIFMGFSQQLAQGTALAAMILPIGLFAAIEYYKKGFVDIKTAACIATAFMLCGYFGAKIAVHLDALTLRRIFAVILIVVAVKLLISK